MPDIGSNSVTVSPIAGLLVVLSVTVPVTVAACAIVPANRKLKAKLRAPNRINLIFLSYSFNSAFLFRDPWSRLLYSLLGTPHSLHLIDFSKQLCSFVLEKASLRNEILLRILARAVLEVQVAQILIELL